MGLIPESTYPTVAKAAITLGAGALALSGYAIKCRLDKIHNDVRKTRIVEDLALNDPILKKIDKATLYNWYALLDYYAPTLAKNKFTVQEVLQNIAQFGKIDLNTIKMLVETENKIADTGKANSDILKNVRQALLPA